MYRLCSYSTSGCDFCHSVQMKQGWVWTGIGWVTAALWRLGVWIPNLYLGTVAGSFWLEVVRSEPMSWSKRSLLERVTWFIRCKPTVSTSCAHQSTQCSLHRDLGVPYKSWKSIPVFFPKINFRFNLTEELAFFHMYYTDCRLMTQSQQCMKFNSSINNFLTMYGGW